jgi:hypothetical protein
MDTFQYTTLVEALADDPDPRKPWGKHYSWTLLLALISGASSIAALPQW